jgi:hypothetical protein
VAGGSGKVGNLPIETGLDQLGCLHVASHILPSGLIGFESVKAPGGCTLSMQGISPVWFDGDSESYPL